MPKRWVPNVQTIDLFVSAYCLQQQQQQQKEKCSIDIFVRVYCLQGKGLGSGHKTLLYGNAILLRHSNSDM